MGVLTKDPNVLMKRWMEVYADLMVLEPTDLKVSDILSMMKYRLSRSNEWVMEFFKVVGADPEAAP